MSSDRSAQISALVAQLKAGQISKGELFDKLQRLQRGETVRALAASGGAREGVTRAPPARTPAPCPAPRRPLNRALT